MATTLYFRDSAPDWSRGEGDAKLAGGNANWDPKSLTTEHPVAFASATVATVTGTTVGLEFKAATSPTGSLTEWISDPIDQDVTISGTVTFNLWGVESSMNANAGLGCIVQRLNSQGAVVSTVAENHEIGVELGTSGAVRNEAATVTSTNMLKGDRLRARVFADDAAATTMVTGFTITFDYDALSDGVDGNSYITFTENFGFLDGSLISQPSSNSQQRIFGASGTEERCAQSITLASAATLTRADLGMTKVGTPTDNLTLDVVSTLGGTSLGSATVAASTLSTAQGLIAFTFGTPIALTAGTYYLQITRSGARDLSNYCQWWDDTGAPYAGGNGSYSNSGSWSTTGTDFRFIVYSVTAGSTLYLTNTAAAVDPNGASWDAKEAWTSRGAGVVSATTSDVAGPTAPIAATASAGGNSLEWFTKQLTAFTLDGLVACNIRALEVGAASNAAVRCEIALTASDGTSPVVWGAANDGVELGTSEAALTWNVAGDSTAVTDGQRMRIRVYFDDAPGVAMAASTDMTLYWAGTSAAASGDTYITLPQTVTEYSSVAATSLLYDSSPYQHILVQ